MALTAFISYSHADERYLDRLHKHMSLLQHDGDIETWTDHRIVPGAKLNDSVMTALETSDLFIALVSPDYLASNYCYEKEFQEALRRAEVGELHIVPVILEPCDWLGTCSASRSRRPLRRRRSPACCAWPWSTRPICRGWSARRPTGRPASNPISRRWTTVPRRSPTTLSRALSRSE
ncbi:hypothetical protein CPJ18_11045 [Agrobacterium rosae]|uniref:TIR domain-containing protein n=1 Tax=Agrobacterium rosae TaxID=1972867 RepID=A0AAE5RXA9_9HYPH|nr:toll/interleukin-1 receptor domain-containing protein [Agrobacterium rosae]KAA3514054.1 toll/interleukin-1 receptor domain-containing protein [Agrobacterium rosae]KAA3522721.1 toll/interleukin-1 receptor domain-containing protein [Agrobacterium rosae]MCM2434018.1 toll/interleukin-1 receptor domain-containing protein [Agrobacterium rosae]MQB47384.1 toll/interleukin-1 receptor domain-containing protein [Agrobacterium rosae]POO51105.1 hypothetical protein CPJ18_11045 [Agrobacterium rosae]